MARISQASTLLLLGGAACASFYLAQYWPLDLRDLAAGPDDGAAFNSAVANDTPAVASAAVAASAPAAASAPVALVRDKSLSIPERAHVIPESKGDAFAALSWLPPVVAPAPPAPPPKPPAPSAPPLPFTYVGMIETGAAQPQAFLAKGDALIVVIAGDLLENGSYRVESLSPQQVVLTYLPLNTRQTLNVPGPTP